MGFNSGFKGLSWKLTKVIQTTVSFIASPTIAVLSRRKPASAEISLGGHADLLHQLPITTTCFFLCNQQTDDAAVLYGYQSFAKGMEKSLTL